MIKPNPVAAINDKGDVVKIYPSAAEAVRCFGLHYDAIDRVCRGERRSTPGGFLWKYMD